MLFEARNRCDGATEDATSSLPAESVNDSIVRLGVLRGEYHWHKHDEDDELFFVLEGALLVDLEDATVGLRKWQGYVVPHGVVHRFRAPERAIVLMVETSSIIPTGDEP